MSAEEYHLRFDVRKERAHQIRCETRKIIADFMSEDEDNIRFDVRKGG
jgi:hypothetical protein